MGLVLESSFVFYRVWVCPLNIFSFTQTPFLSLKHPHPALENRPGQTWRVSSLRSRHPFSAWSRWTICVIISSSSFPICGSVWLLVRQTEPRPFLGRIGQEYLPY